MMKKNRMFSLMLVFIILLSTNVFASGEYYTESEVLAKINAIFDKYSFGGEYKIGDYARARLNLSKTQVNRDLVLLEEHLAEMTSLSYISATDDLVYYIYNKSINFDNVLTKNKLVSNFDGLTGIPTPRKTATAYTNINQGLVSVQMEMSCIYTAFDTYTQGSLITNIYGITSRIYGTHTGTATWRQKKSSSDYSNDVGNVNIEGTLDTSISVVGIPVSSTYDYCLGFSFRSI